MPNTAQDLTGKIKADIETLAGMTSQVKQSAEFKRWLDFSSSFYRYSANNMLLILYQNPNATMVKGFRAWQKYNRMVQKGEHGIAILAPCLYADKDDATKSKIYFKVAYVFDVTQTQGDDLPAVDWKTTEKAEELQDRLTAFITARGWLVSNDIEGEAEGMTNQTARTIQLKPSAGTAVLIHEIAHAILHNKSTADRPTKETEAEAVSYVICQHYGIESKAPAYLAGWSSPELLKASLDTITATAKEIITAVEIEPDTDD